VLEYTLQLEHEGASASALVALAPRISVTAVRHVLSVVARLSDSQDQARVLISIIPRVPPDLVQAAGAAVRRLTNQRASIKGLLALSVRLPGADQVAMVGEALSIASSIDNRFDQTAGITACIAAVANLTPDDRDWSAFVIASP
jgi:hypothetical protein